MLKEYYHERDWDIHTGRPSPAKLAALGLENLER
jgi:aldehyde:ferredoxin oxidoreductase